MSWKTIAWIGGIGGACYLLWKHGQQPPAPPPAVTATGEVAELQAIMNWIQDRLRQAGADVVSTGPLPAAPLPPDIFHSLPESGILDLETRGAVANFQQMVRRIPSSIRHELLLDELSTINTEAAPFDGVDSAVMPLGYLLETMERYPALDETNRLQWAAYEKLGEVYNDLVEAYAPA